LALGVDVGAARLDRVELVSPDAPVDDLLFAGRRVEAPARAGRHDRDRKRIVVLSHHQGDPAPSGPETGVPLVGNHQPVAALPVGPLVPRPDQPLAVCAENCQHGLLIARLGRIHQRLRGRFGRRETALRDGPGHRQPRGCQHAREDENDSENTPHRIPRSGRSTLQHWRSLSHHRLPPPRPPPPPPPRAPPPPPPPARAPPPPDGRLPALTPPPPMLWRLAWPRLL